MRIRCDHCFQLYDPAYGICPECGYTAGQAPEPFCLVPGTRLQERYIIGSSLGMGGFGITYKAFDTQLDMVVAVKEYFPSGQVNRASGSSRVFLVASKQGDQYLAGKERFLDEARDLARFSKHRNIVNVFNFFEANDTAYIVMEYLDGKTLSQTLRDLRRPLPSERCAAIAIDVCKALRSIHEAGIVHRDVSPDNIMLCKDGTVKLFDFGAARFARDKAQSSRVTVIVKPGFAPPEQYDNVNKQDARTDIYALGATLYYAVTGKKPLESLDRKYRDNMPPPRALVPDTPDYLNGAVMKAMSLEPRHRFASAEEFQQVLEGKVRKKPRKGKAFLGIAAAVLVLAAAGLGIWLHQRDTGRVPDGSIQLWYMSTGDPVRDKALDTAWRSTVDGITETFPNVSITAVPIPAAEYAQRLELARKSGTMPDIYESTLLSDTARQDAQSVQTLLEAGEDRLYLDALDGDRDQYPTSLVVPAIYVHGDLGKTPRPQSLMLLKATCDQDQLMASVSAAGLHQQAFGDDLMGLIHTDALERFLAGDCLIYMGTTADLLTVQQGMLGKEYQILFPDTGTGAYSYGCLWSCDPGDKDTTKICQAVLSYLTSDSGQDHLNIRSFAALGNVPVTPEGVKELSQIYTELSGLDDHLGTP